MDVDETSHCRIPKGGLEVEFLKQTVTSLWDEVPMQDKYCRAAVDCSLQDVLDSNRPFGGLVVVWE